MKFRTFLLPFLLRHVVLGEATNNKTTLHRFLFAVFSGGSRDNLIRRQTIRQTWGEILVENCKWLSYTCELLFVVGHDVVREASDVISFDGVDNNYVNLHLRTAALMSWASAHKSGYYVMKTDDDSYLFPRRFLSAFSLLPKSKLYWGRFHKAKVKQYEWHYASGMGYVLSPDVVDAIVQYNASIGFNGNIMSQYVPEDVMIGLALLFSNVTRVDDERFHELTWTSGTRRIFTELSPSSILVHHCDVSDFARLAID